MKYYLIALLLIIMAAGGRTMFQIAYDGMAKEHEFSPGKETGGLMILAVWYVLMMVATVLLLNYKDLPKRNLLIIMLSLAILGPTVYMFLTR
jgi:hypothetical protein